MTQTNPHRQVHVHSVTPQRLCIPDHPLGLGGVGRHPGLVGELKPALRGPSEKIIKVVRVCPPYFHTRIAYAVLRFRLLDASIHLETDPASGNEMENFGSNLQSEKLE